MIARRELLKKGWPIHGLVANGQLSHNGSNYTVAAGTQGAILYKSPYAPGGSQNDYDLSRGYEWRDYAILNGPEKYLYGNELGAQKWIYPDANGNCWVIRQEQVSAPAEQATFNLYLESLFGRSDDIDYPVIDRLLATITFDISIYSASDEANDNVTDPFADNSAIVATIPQPSPDGTKALTHIIRWRTHGFDFNFTIAKIAGEKYWLSDVLEAVISGSGSIDIETLGDGITGNLTVIHTYDVSLSVPANFYLGVLGRGRAFCGGYQDYPETTTIYTISLDGRFWYFYDNDNNLQHVRYRYDETETNTYERVDWVTDVDHDRVIDIILDVGSLQWTGNCNVSAATTLNANEFDNPNDCYPTNNFLQFYSDNPCDPETFGFEAQSPGVFVVSQYDNDTTVILVSYNLDQQTVSPVNPNVVDLRFAWQPITGQITYNLTADDIHFI